MGKGSQQSINVVANQPLRDRVIAALVDFKDAWSWLEQSRITISKQSLPVQDWKVVSFSPQPTPLSTHGPIPERESVLTAKG